MSPGLTDESVNFMMVEVDGNAPENKNPKQKLDDGEIIEVYNFFFLNIYNNQKSFLSQEKCI